MAGSSAGSQDRSGPHQGGGASDAHPLALGNSHDLKAGWLPWAPAHFPRSWILFSQPKGFGRLSLESGQNPYRPSIARLHHVAGIKLLSVHRVPVDPIRVQSGEWAATAASNPRILRAGQGLVIPARPRFGQLLFPEALVGHKFVDA